MKKRRVYVKQYSALLVLAGLLWIVPSVGSQAVPPAPPAQYPGQDNDTTRREMASFDSFLDKHPEIAEQLRRNPSVVDDREYVNNHPELQAYLQDHPQVREELRENPRAFMRQENRFDRRDDDATRRELANFDGFLDKHPEVAEQLRKNPALADNQEFLQNHPALQQFLQEHSGVREQLAQDPRIFMRHEDHFDRRDDDATRRELANFDGFLDKHPEVAEQLRKNPALADNQEFLQNHPALQQFLQEHSGVREQLAQDPRIFMRHEDHFDRRDDDATRRELANFDGFLDKHPEVAEQLRKNPALADNQEFLQNHPALQQFLQEHSGVREQLAQDPRIFMRHEDHFDRRDDDATRRELANFDGFLDKHPEIAEQLRKNPALADNKEFLQNHPALQQFLQEHSGVREQLAQDPRIFMRHEDHFDRRDDDATRRELANFDGFLDKHPEIAEQLSKNPSLAKNEEYLENHPELREYLKNHSGVQEELAENPQAFMNSMKRFDNSGTKKEMVEPKPKQ